MERHVTTSDTTKSTDASVRPDGAQPARSYLLNRWVLLAIGGLVLLIGAILNWGWLVAVGIAPIIIAVAPCAIMCGLGLCAMKMKGNSNNQSK